MYGHNGQLPGGPTSLFFLFLNTDFVGSINTRNICLILSTIYSFISASVCIDRGLSTLLWPGPILLIRRSWPYVIHHLHFMNMYRLYIAWYRPILLMYMLVALIDMFVIKLFSYYLKDHTYILQTPVSTVYGQKVTGQKVTILIGQKVTNHYFNTHRTKSHKFQF